jgi:hypothetical protein
MTMNEYAADVSARSYATFDRILTAEIAKFRALGDIETSRRLFTVGAWVAREYLMLAAARETLADDPPFDVE